MMGRVAGVGVLVLLMVVAGLLPAPALAQVRYTCRGGATVLVDYGGQHAELTFLGVRYFLPQVPLAEGSRYSDGRFTWTVTRTQEGTLTHDGAIIASECRTGFFPPPGGVTLPGGPPQATYTCADGGTVSATYSGSTALVTFRGRTHRLEQVPLAEGSRYTDGRFTWTVNRANEGTLTRDGAVVARDCRAGFVSQPGGGVTLPAPGGFTQTVYTCAGGGTVTAAYSGQTAIVTFQGNTYRMVQVPLFGGSRYTDGRLIWTVAGDTAMLTTSDGAVLFRECRASAASQSGATTYTCAAGGPVIATYSGSTALVTLQGNTYRLIQVPLAEGTRYTDGRFTWTVNRGDEGTLTYLGAVVAQGCRNTTFQPREPER